MRVAAFLVLDRVHHPDLWESEEIASNLLAGRGFVFQFLGTTYRSYMEPLYPALCAAVYALTGHSFLALGLVQAGLGTLLVALVFWCGRRLGGDAPALGAAALAAVHPGLVVYTTKFHPFILDSLLVLAVLAACLLLSTERPWRSALLLGAALGLCALSRATILVCLPVIAWWVWRRLERRMATMAVVLATAALVVAPWVARNHAVHHRFVLTRSGTALVFWLGNNPHAFTGSATTAGGGRVLELMPADERQRLLHLDELGQQDLLRAEAGAYVRAQPLAFLRRWAVKFSYFWWQSPQAGQLYPAAWFRLYQAFYLVTMALVVAAIAVHRRRPETWLVVGFCLAIALVQSAYYVEGRHRLTIEPLLLLLGGQGLAGLLQLLPWGKKVSS